MNTNYPKKPHESPFADYPPKHESPSDNPPPPKPNNPASRIQPERADKAAFSVFIGVFFLLAGFPTAYWANYTYHEYKVNVATLQDWRENPDSIPKGLPAKDEIYVQTTRVENSQLQAFLFGAASLLLFSLAALMIIRAIRISRRMRTSNFQYQLVNWRQFPKPTARIEIKLAGVQNIALGFLFAFFGGMSVLLLLSGGNRPQQSIIAFFCLLILFVVFYLVIRAKRKAVSLLDASGIIRRDGRIFSWNEFQGVVTRTAMSRYGQRYVWRIELAFAGGEAAWIIPQHVKNREEVFAFINTLPPAVPKNAL